ncbi:RagB/SusD family nutrient uptake outer membrane protein [Lutibacter sp. HS1-25]|uniref:RagB/SusD family nutrient uptake outer membrane protein n=1 Tax=Lutibacter sp. HS1-25 TaxID=2485000 RepID=UPI001011C1CA|nr:RagB/SusD family nutrient uptake outer membrane protein [Lutibacter sp. HS1-25]RXP44527.1 RagB/SusD family nutrient uptake outer membrane protein [Lutibacter sp. HS1-25]
MKTLYKFLILTIISSISFVGCDLEETPPFLASDNIYTTVEGANVALNGAYGKLTNHFFYAADYHHLTDFTSGFFTSGKASDTKDIAALNPSSSQNYVENLWALSYSTIAVTNDIITNISETNENPQIRNVLGQAYFLRAHVYFNLVRLYGAVPLRVEASTADNLHMARTPVDEVYNQIIADANKAKTLLFDKSTQTIGRPSNLAPNMILAKVYMTLAGNNDNSPYWQLAYNEAIQMYGKYSLVGNYGDLWNSESTANNNSESIFEIQFNEEVPSKLVRLFTHSNAYSGVGWQRIKPNPETIDDHMARYPGDPRIDLTFISSYIQVNGSTSKVYPTNTSRSNTNNAYPFIYKYWTKDLTATTDATNFNYVHFRYADLLLMLAEIENELNGPANAYKYVNEVLARARNTGNSVQPADWSGLSQEEFRSAIMKEYQFELLAEGQDWFNNRRRGYDYFKQNIIDPHNARNEKAFDIVYPDNNKTMLMPIPGSEINANQQISAADQNPGY